MKEVYYGTKIVRRFNSSTIFHFEKWWGFEKGEMVNVHVRRLDCKGPDINTVKKVCMLGNSLAIFLDRDLGFNVGDKIVIAMSRLDANEGDGDDTDAGSGTEEEDKGLSG